MKKELSILKIINRLLLFIFVATIVMVGSPKNTLAQSVNLINDSSFENSITGIDGNWSVWKDSASVRTYELYRSYSAPFGFGTYSAAVEATGAVNNRWQAGLVSKNSFKLETNSSYYFIFYTKADSPATISFYLEDAKTFKDISPIIEKNVTTDWQRQTALFTNVNAVDALLTFTFGDVAAGNSIYFDGIQLFKSDIKLTTTELKCYHGDRDKVININGIGNFLLSEVKIELPFYDNLTGSIGQKKFSIKTITANGITFDIPEQTFPGIGSVYVNDALAGQFDYNVQPKLTSITPVMPRANDDLTVVGTGFHPLIDQEKTYLVVRSIDIMGKTHETWIKPHTIDSGLKQITATLPLGIISGDLYVQTSFFNKAGKSIANKSNKIVYKVKPVIYGIKWAKRGYNQVGDKLTISGKGISNSPQVNFYSQDGKKIETRAAKLSEIGQSENIQIESTKKTNAFFVTVTAGGVESDRANALSFSASPKVASIKTKTSRIITGGTKDLIAAGKVGEEVVLNGDGLVGTSGQVSVEFQGASQRILVTVTDKNISADGKTLKVNIPAGAQNGYVNAVVNSEKSNAWPLEIIPTIISISPSPVVPGEYMYITANGVGPNIALARVYFNLNGQEQISLQPETITLNGDTALIKTKAPLALANSGSIINLQYDRWQDNSKSSLSVYPNITGAAIDLDDKILTISGYGFSLKPAENVITYRYNDADKTIVTPKVQVLGVYATADGQEIRIKILDDYHYGYVQVKVGDKISNEVSFGPVAVKKIVRRVEYVKSMDQVMGVLYISGYNFGTKGGVKVGANWATVHYRSDNFIIAVINQAYIYDNPVLVAKE